jgi:outer membrane protein insertion porin family
MSYDKRNNMVVPSDGYIVSLANDCAGLGGNVRYLSNILSGGWYWPLNTARNIVLNLRARYKFLFKLGKPIRLADRYTMGGSDFRGFDQSGLGPRDRFTGDAIGGKQAVVTTAQVTFPLGLPKEFDIKGGVFTDWGSLWDSGIKGQYSDRVVSDGFSLRGSAGIEFILKLPIGGTIVLSFAKTLKKVKKVDQSRVFRIQFGTEYY